ASTAREKSEPPRSHAINTPVDAPRAALRFLRNRETPRQGASAVADLGFIVLTVVLFAALAWLVRAVER
ncbi:MAG TPA: hypothetical protein VJ777_16175, partial [Mycobacterium sp.]|nr:hypothetical protein [Mycobacterium sp.]